MMGGSEVKVAVVQAVPAMLDIDKAVEKTIALMDEAGGQGVQLIAFPETWLSSYPWWIWLGTPAHAMHYTGEYRANSIQVGSEHDVALAAAAKRNKLHAVIGVSEKQGGSLYMGQWHYGPDGEVISRRRKLKPTMAERTVFGEGDGSDLFVTETDIGKIGSLCCWEHLHSLVKYSMNAQGEQIHVAAWPAASVYTDISNALGPDVTTAISQIYAVENQCFVLASFSVISEDICDRLCETDEQRSLIKPGGGYSRIFAPDGSTLGDILAPGEEGLLIADLPLGMIEFSKTAFDPVGHYSRPDSLRLLHNKERRSAVIEQYNPSSDKLDDEAEDAPESV